jgi:hypothetical protein
MASKEIVDALSSDGRVDPELERRWARAVATSGDPAEGVAAFAERRSPEFTWTPAEERR